MNDTRGQGLGRTVLRGVDVTPILWLDSNEGHRCGAPFTKRRFVVAEQEGRERAGHPTDFGGKNKLVTSTRA